MAGKSTIRAELESTESSSEESDSVGNHTPERPIVDQYREGKVKSTSTRRVKEILKPYAYKRSELLFCSDGVPFA